MLRHREFDVAEMSLSSYVKSLDLDEPPFVALPVYTSRQFRHAGIFVHADAGIEKPEDLRGKVVGTPEWQLTAGVWIRGILADHHGVAVDSVEYRTGGQETPGRVEKAAVDLTGLASAHPCGETLAAMLATGEIDAFQGPRVPSSFAPGGPRAAAVPRPGGRGEAVLRRRPGSSRSCTSWRSARDVYERHPWVAQTLTKALSGCAKQKAMAELYDASALRFMLPWLIPGLEEARALLGEDYWSYGLEANETRARRRSCATTTSRGCPRRYEPAELFAPESTEAFVI